MQEGNNPTLKGRLINIEKQAKKMKETLGQNQSDIKRIIDQINEGTEATILSDKINFIKDLLTQKLQNIDYKIKKHIQQQKQKNNQLLELISVTKNQKLRLQSSLQILAERIEQIKVKIGAQSDEI